MGLTISRFRYAYETDLADLDRQINQAKAKFKSLESMLKGVPVGGIKANAGALGLDSKSMNAEARLITARTKSTQMAIIEQERLNKSMTAGSKAVTQYGTNAQSVYRGIAGIIGTIGVARLGKEIISSATKMETLKMMLANIEGSAAAADKRFEQFRVLSKEPVLDPFNLSKAYVGLRSVNIESELSIRFMKGIANVLAGVGAGNEQFANVMYQFVQMGGATKLLGQDLRVINESFPQMRKYLAEAFGTADPERLAKEGHNAIEIFQKLTAEFEKQPHFLGKSQAAQENFTQSLRIFEAALAKDTLPTLTDFLNGLTNIMDKFSELDEGTKKIIGRGVVGSFGILGIGAAVVSVTNALDMLGMSKGLKVLASGALSKPLPSPSGLVWQTGGEYTKEKAYQQALARENPGVYTGIGGSGFAAGLAATAALASVTWAIDRIYVSATSVEIVEKGSTQWSKEQLTADRRALQRFIESQLTLVSGGVSYQSKLSDLNAEKIGGTPFLKNLVESAGFNLKSQSTLLSILKAIAPSTYGSLKPTKQAGPPEPEKPTPISFDTLEDKLKSLMAITSQNYKMSESEQLGWWQSQLGLPLTDEARLGVQHTIRDLLDGIATESSDKQKKFAQDWWNAIANSLTETGLNNVKLKEATLKPLINAQMDANADVITKMVRGKSIMLSAPKVIFADDFMTNLRDAWNEITPDLTRELDAIEAKYSAIMGLGVGEAGPALPEMQGYAEIFQKAKQSEIDKIFLPYTQAQEDQISKENSYQERLTGVQDDAERARQARVQAFAEENARIYESAWNFRLDLEKNAGDKLRSLRTEIDKIKDDTFFLKVDQKGGREAVLNAELEQLNQQLSVLQNQEMTESNLLEIEKERALISNKQAELQGIQNDKSLNQKLRIIDYLGNLAVGGVQGNLSKGNVTQNTASLISSFIPDPTLSTLVNIGGDLLGAMFDRNDSEKDNTSALDTNTTGLNRNSQLLKSVLESYINVPSTFTMPAAYVKPGSQIPFMSSGGDILKDGLAYLHAGESVITKALNSRLSSYTNNVSSSSNVSNSDSRQITNIFNINGNDTTKIKNEVISAISEEYNRDKRRGFQPSR